MRLIDEEDAYNVLTDYYHHRTETQHEALKEALSRVPTIDAVPVVRCKDCKHAKMTYRGECKYCNMWDTDDDVLYLEGDFYCAFGERREDEAD